MKSGLFFFSSYLILYLFWKSHRYNNIIGTIYNSILDIMQVHVLKKSNFILVCFKHMKIDWKNLYYNIVILRYSINPLLEDETFTRTVWHLQIKTDRWYYCERSGLRTLKISSHAHYYLLTGNCNVLPKNTNYYICLEVCEEWYFVKRSQVFFFSAIYRQFDVFKMC